MSKGKSKIPYEWETDPDSPLYNPDRVGPGRPPNEHKWKRGGPSPNPKGRPKKKPTMQPDLKKALEDALNETVTATQGDRKITLTKAQLGIQQLINQYAKGDRYARRDLMDFATRLGVDLSAGSREAIEEALGATHESIIEAALRRRLASQSSAPEASEQSRVMAPPELLDDDVAAPSPSTVEAPPTENPKEKVRYMRPGEDKPAKIDPDYLANLRRHNAEVKRKIEAGEAEEEEDPHANER